ncbi:MAG TPA: DsrE family protein [Ktedonobacterales bacterium]
MNILLILNDQPYGSERSYNGLRLGLSLRKQAGVQLKIFLLGDAVACAKAGQKTPEGAYNVERMLKGFTFQRIPVGACGTCMDARGITDAELLDGVHRSSMDELTAWTVEADKALVF